MFAFTVPDVGMIFTWIVSGLADIWPYLVAAIVLCAIWLPLVIRIWNMEDENRRLM